MPGVDALRAAVPVPKELVGPCVLLLLGQAAGHGYGLAERLRSVGFALGDLGVVYGALRRLERSGLASSALECPKTGPARRIYALTPEGQRARDDWADTVAGLAACFCVPSGAPGGRQSSS